jgi:uncharacterized membrane protein
MSQESSDVKQFFRFLVSGYVCLTYYFGFLLASSAALRAQMTSVSFTSSGLLGAAASSLVFSVSLGFFIHEIHISVQSPYREKRFGHERKCFRVLRELNGASKATDQELQLLLEYAKYGQDERETPSDSHIEKELSNRYSYYYGRMDAAVFAPILAFALFLASGYLGWFGAELSWADFARVLAVITAILVISGLLVWHAMKLLDEIDSIETRIAERKKLENPLKSGDGFPDSTRI